MTYCSRGRGTEYCSVGVAWSSGAAGGCSDSGNSGRTRCNERAPRGHVSRVPNSCQIAVLYFSVSRNGGGEDATDLTAWFAEVVVRALSVVLLEAIF